MRILVVGAGMYVTGRGTPDLGTVLPSLAQFHRRHPLESVTVVALSNDPGPVATCVARIEREMGVRLAVDYVPRAGTLAETLAGRRFDCAVVSVPDDLHHQVTTELLEQDLHCLVVKPLTPTLREARALVDLARKRGLYGAVELHKRFDPQNLYVRKALRDGSLGRPLYAVVGYSQRVGIPARSFRRWAERTNIFQYLGVHYVDLLHFLTGLRPKRAMAVGTRGVLDALGVRTWDAVLATVIWGGDDADQELISQLAIGWVDPDGSSAMSDQRFFLVGSEGRIDLDQKDRGIQQVTSARGAQTPNPHFSMLLEDANGTPEHQGYGYRSIERFLLDVLDLGAGRVAAGDLDASRPSFLQALVSTAVVQAVNESLADGGTWRQVDA